METIYFTLRLMLPLCVIDDSSTEIFIFRPSKFYIKILRCFFLRQEPVHNNMDIVLATNNDKPLIIIYVFVQISPIHF